VAARFDAFGTAACWSRFPAGNPLRQDPPGPVPRRACALVFVARRGGRFALSALVLLLVKEPKREELQGKRAPLRFGRPSCPSSRTALSPLFRAQLRRRLPRSPFSCSGFTSPLLMGERCFHCPSKASSLRVFNGGAMALALLREAHREADRQEKRPFSHVAGAWPSVSRRSPSSAGLQWPSPRSSGNHAQDVPVSPPDHSYERTDRKLSPRDGALWRLMIERVSTTILYPIGGFPHGPVSRPDLPPHGSFDGPHSPFSCACGRTPGRRYFFIKSSIASFAAHNLGDLCLE